MDLGEIGWDGVDWIDVAQEEGSCEPSGCIKCWEVLLQFFIGCLLKHLQYIIARLMYVTYISNLPLIKVNTCTF
jgi:hypothetical protein